MRHNNKRPWEDVSTLVCLHFKCFVTDSNRCIYRLLIMRTHLSVFGNQRHHLKSNADRHVTFVLNVNKSAVTALLLNSLKHRIFFKGVPL